MFDEIDVDIINHEDQVGRKGTKRKASKNSIQIFEKKTTKKEKQNNQSKKSKNNEEKFKNKDFVRIPLKRSETTFPIELQNILNPSNSEINVTAPQGNIIGSIQFLITNIYFYLFILVVF